MVLRAKKTVANQYDSLLDRADTIVPDADVKAVIRKTCELVELVVVRTRKKEDPAAYQDLMIEVLGLYISAVQRSRSKPGKLAENRIASYVFRPLFAKDQTLDEQAVHEYVQTMREGGVDRLFVDTPGREFRLEGLRA